MKKMLCLIISVFLSIALLAGCGTTNNQTNTTKDTNASTLIASTTAPKAEKVTLRMGTFQSEEKDLIDKFIADFQTKNPDITVDVQYITGDQFPNIIKAQFATNDAPDVLSVWSAAEFVRANYLLDISDFNSVKLQNPNINLYQFNGKTYGLAVGQACLGMIANNTVLKKAGVTSLPKNFSEFLSACEKIKAAGITPIAYGDKEGTSSETFGGWAGETLMTDEEGKGIPVGTIKPSQSKGVRNAFEKTKVLADKGYFPDQYMGLSNDSEFAKFAQNERAFKIGAQWNFKQIASTNPDCDFSLFPIPYADEGQSRAMSFISNGYAANAATKNKEAVSKLFDAIASDAWGNLMNLDYPLPFQGVNSKTSKQDIEFNTAYGQYLSPTYFQLYNWVDPAGISRRNMQLYLTGKTIDEALASYDAEEAKVVVKN